LAEGLDANSPDRAGESSERAVQRRITSLSMSGLRGIRCDHRVDTQVEAAFNLVLRVSSVIDILVNNVWGGYERMVENGNFTLAQAVLGTAPLALGAMFSAGVRAHYQTSQLAAPAMIAQRRGLIVNISFWAAQKHIGNVAYGVSKAATDKMTADMATELKPHGVAVISLYPGLVGTEKVMEAAEFLNLTNSESPEFIGRTVAALAADPKVLRYTGKVLVRPPWRRNIASRTSTGRGPVL
jgi:dehydrogenase/reductase SDR family member 1